MLVACLSSSSSTAFSPLFLLSLALIVPGVWSPMMPPDLSLYSIPEAQKTFNTVNLKIKSQLSMSCFCELFVYFPFGEFVKNELPALRGEIRDDHPVYVCL